MRLSYGLTEKGEFIAFALGRVKHWYTGTEYMIEELWVIPARQRRGVGSAFLARIRNSLRKKGISAIVLQTDRSLPAYDFYCRNGFSEASEQAYLIKEV